MTHQRSRRTHPQLTLAMALASLAAGLAAAPAAAAERIYVAQLNPPSLHTLELGGGAFDEDPDETGVLETPFETWGLAATDHLFLAGSAFNVTSFAALSPNGVALPPVDNPLGAPRAAGRAGMWVIGDYALYAGGQPGAVGVVDLDPTSPDYMEQIAGLDLGVGVAGAAAISPDGATLYVVRTQGSFPGLAAMVDAVNIENLPSLTLRHSTPIATSLGNDLLVDRLRAITIDTTDYLMMFRRDIQFLELDAANGPPTLVHTLSLNHPDFPARTRSFSDGYFDAASERAVVATTTPGSPISTARHALLVLELAGLDDGPPSVTVAAEIETEAPGTRTNANGRLEGASSGANLLLLTQASPPGAQDLWIHAWPTAALLAATGYNAHGAIPAVSHEIAPGPQAVGSTAWMVHEQVVEASPAPAIECAVDATSGEALIENDVPRTLRIAGSGLDAVARVFLGNGWLGGVVPVSGSEIEAQVPELTPAADTFAGVVTTNEAVVRRDGLKVVNPGDFLPGTVAYVATSDRNKVTVLNAATESEVVTHLDAAVQSPNGVAVSRDGKLLFTSGFRDFRVAVHCLVEDLSGLGCTWNELLATVGVESSSPTDLELSADGTRLFVDGLWPTVDVIDTTTAPPSFLGSIWISTYDDDPFRGITRRIAVAPVDAHGREWLYVTNDRDPHLLAVDVTGIAGDVQASEVVEVSVPGIGLGRSDGLVVDPLRSRLYFHHFWDSHVHVFRIDEDEIDSDRLVWLGTVAIPDGAADVRNMALRPDGRYLYLAARAGGKVDIFDLGDPEDACVATQSCPLPEYLDDRPTGAQSNRARVSPAGEFLFVPAFGPQAVTIIDVRDGGDLHKVLTATGTSPGPADVAFSPGIATPAGGDVEVTPTAGVTVTFDDVVDGGSTTVTSANVSEIPIAADFEIAGGTTPVYYDVSTTATFEGLVTLCFAYDDTGMTPEQEASLVLLHEETCSPLLAAAGAAGCGAGSYGTDLLTDWTEFECTPSGVEKGDCAEGQQDSTLAGYITTNPVDTAGNTICGRVGTFSQFVAAVRTDWEVAIDVQPGAAPNELSPKSKGKLEVAILSSALVDATTVVVSTVELAGVGALAKADVVDVNLDGRPDLVVKFTPPTLGLAPGPHELELTAELADGRVVHGSDQVIVK